MPISVKILLSFSGAATIALLRRLADSVQIFLFGISCTNENLGTAHYCSGNQLGHCYFKSTTRWSIIAPSLATVPQYSIYLRLGLSSPRRFGEAANITANSNQDPFVHCISQVLAAEPTRAGATPCSRSLIQGLSSGCFSREQLVFWRSDHSDPRRMTIVFAIRHLSNTNECPRDLGRALCFVLFPRNDGFVEDSIGPNDNGPWVIVRHPYVPDRNCSLLRTRDSFWPLMDSGAIPIP